MQERTYGCNNENESGLLWTHTKGPATCIPEAAFRKKIPEDTRSNTIEVDR